MLGVVYHNTMHLSPDLCRRLTLHWQKVRSTSKSDMDGGACIETVFKHPVYSSNMIIVTTYLFLRVKRIELFGSLNDSSGQNSTARRAKKLPRSSVVCKYLFTPNSN